MLELYEAGSAYERLEEYLERLWGRDGMVADLFLGYGLSSALRRESTPSPPEPCPLPLLACRIRPAARAGVTDGSFSCGEWERSWDDDGYAAAITAVRAAIARGDVYQVNLVQHLSAAFRGDVGGVAAALAPLRPLQPRPFSGPGWAVVSASPELFLARRGRRLVTAPIKGTRPAGVESRARRTPPST